MNSSVHIAAMYLAPKWIEKILDIWKRANVILRFAFTKNGNNEYLIRQRSGETSFRENFSLAHRAKMRQTLEHQRKYIWKYLYSHINVVFLQGNFDITSVPQSLGYENILPLKFIYSEKAIEFFEISTNYLTGSTQDK